MELKAGKFSNFFVNADNDVLTLHQNNKRIFNLNSLHFHNVKHDFCVLSFDDRYALFEDKDGIVFYDNEKYECDQSDIVSIRKILNSNKLINVNRDKRFFCTSWDDDADYLIMCDMENHRYECNESKFYFTYSIKGNNILLSGLSKNKKIESIDFNKNKVWEYFSNKSNYVNTHLNSRIPHGYKNSIIIHLGGDEYYEEGYKKYRNCTIVCLDLETGKEIWTQELQDEVRSCEVNGDRVYIGSKGLFYVLDAETGNVLIQKNILNEFDESEIREGASEEGFCFGDNQYIYYFNVWPNSLLVYSHDGHKLIKRFDMPEFHPLIPHMGSSPIQLDGKYYISLTSAKNLAGYFTLGGMLEIDPDTINEPLQCDWDTSPDFALNKVKNGDKHSYIFNVSAQNKDDIFRFGIMKVNLALIPECKTIWKDKDSPMDHDFNGEVIIKINQSALESNDNSDAIFDLMIDELNSNLGDYLYTVDGVSLSYSWRYI